jgi:hypothetical protein
VGRTVTELAEQVRDALEAGDLAAYQHLLAPHVRWGPADEPGAGCHNRSQVLGWYRSARDRGMSATVNEVVAGTDRLLVGLTVSNNQEPGDGGSGAARWQVLTVQDGLITDIRGFDDRDEAAARAGIPAH